MTLSGDLRMGITLMRDSFRVMRHNPKLFAFPLGSLVVGATVLGSFLGIVSTYGEFTVGGGEVLILFMMYVLLVFISSLFAAALVHQTRAVIHDSSEPSLRAGLKAAWGVKGTLLAWSFITATVRLLIEILEGDDNDPYRTVLGELLDFGWSLMTFFVVPVAIFEKRGIIDTLLRSANTFEDAWGKTTISLLGIRLVQTLVAAPFLLTGYTQLDPNPLVGAGLLLTGALTGFLVGQTFQAVVKTVLYLYATEGTLPEEFANVKLERLPADRRAAYQGL